MRNVRFVVSTVVSVVVAALLAGAAALVVAGPASASATDPNSFPVIQIHGFDSQECPGSDASYGWAPFDYVMHRAGWTGPLLPVSFYVCDTNGADITGYGADTPTEIGTGLSPGTPRAGYRQDASLAVIARDLAWYVYRNFSVSGQPVDFVSLSMGGIIARTALQRVQSGDPTFPPLLRVAQSITFSTPHRGSGTMAGNGADPGCHYMYQCMEWAADSPLMTELIKARTSPQGLGGTEWTVIGSSAGCDFLPLDTALGLPDALQIDLTAPCYSHIGYFWDIEPDFTATAVIKNGADAATTTNTAAPHSLTLATILLQNPRRAPAPTATDTPTPTPTTPSTQTPTPTATPTPTPTTSTPTPTPTPTTSTPTPTPAPVPPDAIVTPLATVTTTAAVTVRYRAEPANPSATFDLRYRVATATSGLTDWTAPASLQGVSGPTSTLVPPAGTTQYCVSVRTRLGPSATDVSAWSADTCTAIPVDDRSLTRSSGWTAQAESGSFAGTLSRTTVKGATATLTVSGRGVAVVATTCSTCGSVQVSVAGSVVGTVSTKSASTVRRVVLTLPAWASTTTAAVTLRTTSSSPVYLDGLAVLR